MAVKFLVPHTVGALYNEGDVAGFDEATEEHLIKAKVAEAVKSGQATEKKPEQA